MSLFLRLEMYRYNKICDDEENRIKVERAEKDITQQQLAEAVGVSRQTIVAIEKKPVSPLNPSRALKIARYFSKPVESIFILEDND